MMKEIAVELQKLAAFKKADVTQRHIEIMAKDLERNFDFGQIKSAIHYLSRRNKWFPDLADFYDFLAPMKSSETLSMETVFSYTQKALRRAEREEYTPLEQNLFDVISPQLIRDANATLLNYYQKQLTKYLTDHYSKPQEKILQHRKSIENAKLNQIELNKVLTTSL